MVTIHLNVVGHDVTPSRFTLYPDVVEMSCENGHFTYR